MFKFDLGTELKDKITGFKGVAMARTEYLTGCNHYGLLSRTERKEGLPNEIEAKKFRQRLESFRKSLPDRGKASLSALRQYRATGRVTALYESIWP